MAWMTAAMCPSDVHMRRMRVLERTAALWGLETMKKDLSGNRFGRLIVVGPDEPYVSPGGQRHRRWLVKCDCGSEKSVREPHLTKGYTSSCGCLRKEVARESQITHGQTQNPAFKSWRSMIDRCTNQKSHAWPRYGGAGITVCDRWLTLENFLQDMGPRPPGTSIDRIDNTKGYEPGNCRWATAAEQARNTRRNKCTPEMARQIRELAAAGASAAETARHFGLHYETARGIVNVTRWKV